MLQEKLRELAYIKAQTENRQGTVEALYEVVKSLPEFAEFEREQAAVKQLQDKMTAIRSEINDLTLAAYNETGNKKPANGVGIRVGVSYVYDGEVAKNYCLAELPEALKLDTRIFEKYIKGIMEVKPLNFVTTEEKVTPTIASDLSEYLE